MVSDETPPRKVLVWRAYSCASCDSQVSSFFHQLFVGYLGGVSYITVMLQAAELIRAPSQGPLAR